MVINNIKKMREDKNITQEQFAKMIGTSRQTVIALEKGSYNPSVELALKIAHVFGLSVEDLFYLKEEI